MKCALCGYRFDEERADSACKGCFMAKGCKLVKCPNCGYETPPEPALLKRLIRRRSKDAVNRQS